MSVKKQDLFPSVVRSERENSQSKREEKTITTDADYRKDDLILEKTKLDNISKIPQLKFPQQLVIDQKLSQTASSLLFSCPNSARNANQKANQFISFTDVLATKINFYKSITDKEKSQKFKLNSQLKHNCNEMRTIKISQKQNFQKCNEEILTLLSQKEKRENFIKCMMRTYIRRKEVQQQPINILALQQAEIEQQEQINKDKKEAEKQTQHLFFYWDTLNVTVQYSKPSYREGATLIEYKKNLYLYGGLTDTVKNDLWMFSLKTLFWKEVQMKGLQFPMIGRYGHTATQWKNTVIFFGGETNYNSKLKIRECCNDVWTLNLENMEWQLMRVKGDQVEHRRNHAVTIVGSNLFITGGITNDEKLISEISVYNLENLRWKNFQLPEDNQGIAFHKICCGIKKFIKSVTVLGKKYHAPQIQIEGIYSFGGLNNKGQIQKNIKVLKLGYEMNQPIEWQTPETVGTQPTPRYQHSMEYYLPLNSLIIFGGRTDNPKDQQLVFNDIWLLTLSNLMWTNVSVAGIDKYSFNHASCILDSQLIIFGGINQQTYNNREIYTLELDNYRARKKKQNTGKTLKEDIINPIEQYGNEQVEQQRLELSKERNRMQYSISCKTFLPIPSKLDLRKAEEIQSQRASPKIKMIQTSSSGFYSPQSQLHLRHSYQI